MPKFKTIGEKRYVSVTNAAKEMVVTPATIRRWCDVGYLDHRLQPGGHRLVSLDAVEDYNRGDVDETGVGTMRSSVSGHAGSSEGARAELETAE